MKLDLVHIFIQVLPCHHHLVSIIVNYVNLIPRLLPRRCLSEWRCLLIYPHDSLERLDDLHILRIYRLFHAVAYGVLSFLIREESVKDHIVLS